MKSLVNYQEIEKAYNRISNYATKTPLLSSDLLNKEFSSNIFIKAENLQKIGAFKFRGAMNSILKLDDDKKNILAWSSGNHAQAIASACYLTNKNATIVMPEDSPNAKLNGTKSWGANIVTFDRYSESREEIGTNLAKEINAEIIPPFDHPDVINGQGTVGYEIINDCKNNNLVPDLVLCCCGGGGLIAGVSTAIKAEYPNVPIYAVEPEDYNDTYLSLRDNKITEVDVSKKSICDSLLASKPGELTFSINKQNLSGSLLVSDLEALKAMKYAFQYFKIILEPGGAVALASALFNKIDIKNKTVVIIASGGNVDPDIFEKSLKISI